MSNHYVLLYIETNIKKRFLKYSDVHLWIIHLEVTGDHKSIQAKAREERRAQDTILWINFIPGVSIVGKLYVVLHFPMRRYTDLAITDVVKLDTGCFLFDIVSLLKRTCSFLFS